MMPQAGGLYIYLREAFSPLWGFLYGWTFFTVIQTATIAAVAVAFARFSSIVIPAGAEDHYLIRPLHISSGYAFSLSTAQAAAIGVIALLTWTNTRGLEYGRIVQTIFTSAKTLALGALVVVGLVMGWNAAAVHTNFSSMFRLNLRVAIRVAVRGRCMARHHHGGRRSAQSQTQSSAGPGAGLFGGGRAVSAGQPGLHGGTLVSRNTARAL
jgi:amino acid transporter